MSTSKIKLIVEGTDLTIMNIKTGEVFADLHLSSKVPEPVWCETIKNFQELLEDFRIAEEETTDVY